MLKEAKEKLPENATKKKRLKIPRPKLMIQGNQTFVTNFQDMTDTMRREPKHLAKFLFHELAKPGHMKGKTLVLQGKVSRRLIEKKLKSYIREFIYCKECDRPDTKLVKEGRITIMVCEACGARQAVRDI